MNSDELQARIEIAHLISSYVIHADQQAWDKMEWIWAEDAVNLPPGGARLDGRTAIMERFRAGVLRRMLKEAAEAEQKSAQACGMAVQAQKPPFEFTRHNITSSLIDLVGQSSAIGLSYFVVTTNAGLDHCGTYRDEYRRIDGRWLIAQRRTRLEYIAETSYFPFLRPAMEYDRNHD